MSSSRLARLLLAFHALVLVASATGCANLSFQREQKGSLEPYILSAQLVEGKSTQLEVLEALGSPQVLLPVKERDRDRFYYAFFDKSSIRLSVSLLVPIILAETNWDIFVVSLGTEKLWLVRLDFDRQGTLREKAVRALEQDGTGQYFGIDGSIVTTFLEDRDRSLVVTSDDDEIEDQMIEKSQKEEVDDEEDAPTEKKDP